MNLSCIFTLSSISLDFSWYVWAASVTYFKVDLPETCSMLWNVDFPVFALPQAPVQACCFLSCRAIWVGLSKWFGTVIQPAAWKCLIASSFTAVHENRGIASHAETAGPFCSSSKKNRALQKNSALVGGRAFLENLAFELSFLVGSFLVYSKFNSVSTALGRLCSMK